MTDRNSDLAPGRNRSTRSFRGRRVVVAMGVGAALGLSVALFIRTVVANTPVQVVSENYRWMTLLAAVAGGIAGMAIETVRQLQAINPDPAYHKGRTRGGGSSGPGR